MRHLLFPLLLAACGAAAPPPENLDAVAAHAGIRAIDTSTLHAWIARGDKLTVVDVRTPGEWSQGHITGATHIPIDQLKARVGELPKDQPIYLICESGGRSKAGAQTLAGMGIPVVDVHDGMSGWRGAGYPVAK